MRAHARAVFSMHTPPCACAYGMASPRYPARTCSPRTTGASPPRRKGRRGLRRACARAPSLSCVRARARGETTGRTRRRRSALLRGGALKSAVICKDMTSSGVRRARVPCLTRTWRVIESGSSDRARRVDQARLAKQLAPRDRPPPASKPAGASPGGNSAPVGSAS